MIWDLYVLELILEIDYSVDRALGFEMTEEVVSVFSLSSFTKILISNVLVLFDF